VLKTPDQFSIWCSSELQQRPRSDLHEMAETVAAVVTSSNSASSRNNNDSHFHQLNLSGSMQLIFNLYIGKVLIWFMQYSSKGHCWPSLHNKKTFTICWNLGWWESGSENWGCEEHTWSHLVLWILHCVCTVFMIQHICKCLILFFF
jgi:hypothetical protein